MTFVSTATAAPSASHVSVNRPNPVSVGTFVWLASELMFFAGLFAMYFTHRSVMPAEEWSGYSSRLNFWFALGITTVLVLSSVTCQMGVWAAERFQPRRTGSIWQIGRWGMNEWIVLTFVMGAIFVGGQVYEYAELVEHGVTIS
ncbi:MAG: cytochrome c oxidase subunit 3, partial [Cellulomonadaceae bacterium]